MDSIVVCELCKREIPYHSFGRTTGICLKCWKKDMLEHIDDITHDQQLSSEQKRHYVAILTDSIEGIETKFRA